MVVLTAILRHNFAEFHLCLSQYVPFVVFIVTRFQSQVKTHEEVKHSYRTNEV